MIPKRSDFPILLYLDSNDQVYLDSAATSQKPRVVLDVMTDYYSKYNANARRGTSRLTTGAERLQEHARGTVASFIGASDTSSIVFTKNATEALNIVAHGWARTHLSKGDIILISEMEHHSNLIPWQQVAEETGAKLVYIPVSDAGEIDIDTFKQLLSSKVRLVAITHMSNVFGSIVPVKHIITAAHRHGARVVIDGAQAVAHIPVDVEQLDADFYAFSGHKMYGPAGVGVLYGKKTLLEATEPLIFGGSMIEHVDQDHATWDQVPYKFEGGTQNTAAILGLETAIQYLSSFSWSDIHDHEASLVKNVITKLHKLPSVKIYAPIKEHLSIISFTIEGVHPHDAAEVIDASGVTIRAGHHCAEPLMQKLNISGTLRASIGIYNNIDDTNRLVLAVEKAVERFSHARS